MGKPVSTRQGLVWLSLLAAGLLVTAWLKATPSSPGRSLAGGSQGPVAPRRAASPPSPPRKTIEFPLAKTGEIELPANTTHSYSIDLQRGQALRATFDQRGVDIQVGVFDPASQPIVNFDGYSGSLGPEQVVIVAATAGRYRLDVSRNGTAVPEGRYKVSALIVRSANSLDQACEDGTKGYEKGKNLARAGNPSGAVSELRAARDLFRKCGSRSGEADSILKIMAARNFQSDYGAIAELGSEEQNLFEMLGPDPRAVLFLLNRGFAEEWLADSERPMKLYKETVKLAVAVARQLEKAGPQAGARLLEVRDWEVQGRLYLALREDSDTDLRATLISIERALELARQMGSRVAEGKALATLGAKYLEFGDFDRAFEAERLAKESFVGARPDQPWEMRIHRTLARVYTEVDLPERAIISYQNLVRAYTGAGLEAHLAEALNGLSLALYRLDRFEEGLAAEERARKLYVQLKDRRGEATALANELWFLTRLSRFDEARGAFRQAEALAALPQGSTGEAGLLFGLAELERVQGNLEAAQTRIERVLAILEELGRRRSDPQARSLLRARFRDPYDFWIELLMQRELLEPGKGWGLRSFAESDRFRGRGLREALNRKYKTPLADQRMGPERVEELRRLLDEQTVLLQYHLAESEGYLWIVTREKARRVPLPGKRPLEDRVRDAHTALAASYQLTLAENARRDAIELSAILLEPAAPELRAKRTVLISVPPGLEYIPFAVLPFPAKAESSKAWPASLSSRHEVVTIPSLSAIAAMRSALTRRESPSRALAIVDDPVTDREDARFPRSGRIHSRRGQKGDSVSGALPRMKRAKEQSEAVMRLSGQGEVFRLTSFGARRDAFLKARLSVFRHLLFVTHGLWRRNDPEGASLVLSLFDQAGRPIEGFLSASDIEKLDLRADLVVLSGCSTGLGRQVWGEGLAGLSQAFLKAGARRVVVSLWEVDDEATAELMELFYRGIFERRLTPAAALREAQESLRKNPRWSSPYYWGSFVLKGDWS